MDTQVIRIRIFLLHTRIMSRIIYNVVSYHGYRMEMLNKKTTKTEEVRFYLNTNTYAAHIESIVSTVLKCEILTERKSDIFLSIESCRDEN